MQKNKLVLNPGNFGKIIKENELHRLVMRSLYRFYKQDSSLLEDLFHDVIVKLLDEVAKNKSKEMVFEDELHLVKYVQTITKNTRINHFRKEQRSVNTDVAILDTLPSKYLSAHEYSFRAEVLGLLEKALMQMGEEQRAVYVYRSLYDYSRKATSDYLGISEKRIRTHMRFARKHVSDYIKKYISREDLLS